MSPYSIGQPAERLLIALFCIKVTANYTKNMCESIKKIFYTYYFREFLESKKGLWCQTLIGSLVETHRMEKKYVIVNP